MRARLRGVGNVYKYARECVEDETAVLIPMQLLITHRLLLKESKKPCVSVRDLTIWWKIRSAAAAV